jgi:hypothetical protein
VAERDNIGAVEGLRRKLTTRPLRSGRDRKTGEIRTIIQELAAAQHKTSGLHELVSQTEIGF